MLLKKGEVCRMSDDLIAAPVSPAVEIKVPRLPHMSAGAIKYFSECLASSQCYLEYGSGGSTRLATRMGVPFVYSVESDLAFGKSVRRLVSRDNKSQDFKMVKIDFGETAEWGYPKGFDKIREWPKYPLLAWDKILEDHRIPDLILVDGRFRVACFLTSLLRSSVGTKIIFDDYNGRKKYYGLVERFAVPTLMFEGTAVFVRPPTIDTTEVALALASAMIDPR